MIAGNSWTGGTWDVECRRRPDKEVTMSPRDVVTGAFSYTGRSIARDLIARGRDVTTLSNHAPSDAGNIDVFPLKFDDPDSLKRALDGADTLYNTYWVRFVRRDTTF